jgi:hypothetical protein
MHEMSLDHYTSQYNRFGARAQAFQMQWVRASLLRQITTSPTPKGRRPASFMYRAWIHNLLELAPLGLGPL